MDVHYCLMDGAILGPLDELFFEFQPDEFCDYEIEEEIIYETSPVRYSSALHCLSANYVICFSYN